MSKLRLMLSIVAFLLVLAACTQSADPDLAGNSSQSEQVAEVASTAIPPTDTPDPTTEPTTAPARAESAGVRVTSQQAVNKQVEDGSDAEDIAINEIASDRTIRITVASANLRSGPGLVFETIGIVLFNDAFQALAQDELGLWYKVELNDGQQGWIAASVTEEISDEVFETLVDTPGSGSDEETVVEQPSTETQAVETAEEATEIETTADAGESTVAEAVASDDETVEEAEVEAEVEPTEVIELPDPPLAVQINTRKTGIYTEPSLTSRAVTFVVRDEVFLVVDMTDDGKWVLVEVEEGVSGWVRMTRAGALSEEGLAALVGGEVPEGQVGSLVPVDGGSAQAPAASTGSGSGSSASSSAASSAVVGGSFGRTRIGPGSALYFDTDNSGYGVREAIAPSGPSGVIGSFNVPTKPQVSEGWAESEVYSQPSPRIMLLGDEFTAGTTPIANGYRRHLYNLLTNRAFEFDFVGTRNTYTNPVDFDSDHEGHVYYRADQILAGAWGWTSYDPADYVLMLVGMNDVLQGQSAESTGQDIQLIINTLRYLNPNVKIVLSHLPYTADAAINKEIDLVNLQINRLSYVNNTGNSPIYIISQWDIDPATDTYDGIHLNSRGAEKMAQHFYYGLDHFWLVQAKTTGE